MLSAEATNANFIVFGLTGTDLQPTIYSTRYEHANHYANYVFYYYNWDDTSDCRLLVLDDIIPLVVSSETLALIITHIHH